MPEPYFFFCYSRADLEDGEYIERLFERLRDRVAKAAAMGITPDDPERHIKLNRAGFRDQTGVQIGEDWKAKIGKAIQHNGVLVCLCSPNFFSREQTRQFCGKEVTAFLLRDPGTYYVRGPGDQLQLRGARNIIPILWEDPKVMKGSKPSLPPAVLNAIQWAPEVGAADLELVQLYQSMGLRKMARRHPKKFKDLVDTIGEHIWSLASDPLAPLEEVPDIEKLRNAFWQPPHNAPLENSDDPPPTRPPKAEEGPRIEILIAEVRRGGEADPWYPYAGQDSLTAAEEQFANRLAASPAFAGTRLMTRRLRFDPVVPGFVDAAVRVIEQAESDSIRALFVLDPGVLSHAASRDARDAPAD
jgi:hypothetical protein